MSVALVPFSEIFKKILKITILLVMNALTEKGKNFTCEPEHFQFQCS